MKKLLLLLYLLINTLLLAASNTHVFKNISMRQGLTNGFVNDVAMDNHGFLWVATESGLNRIAGNKCTTFTTYNSNINSNETIELCYDKASNSMWVCFKNGNADIIDCNTLRITHYEKDKGMQNRNISYISEAANEGVRIAYDNGNIAHHKLKTKRSETISKRLFPNIKHGVRCIYDDGRDHLYIGLRMDGMYVYNLRTHSVRFFSHNQRDNESLPGNNVRCVFTDHARNTWIGTNLGLALFDFPTGKFRVFKHCEGDTSSLACDNIYQITERNDHTLWIASDMGGVSILDLNRFLRPAIGNVSFSHITHETEGLSSDCVRRIIQDSFGNIWAGTFGNGIDFIPKHGAMFNTLNNQGKPIDNVTGIYRDSRDRLWIGRNNTVYAYEQGKVTHTWTAASRTGNVSTTIYTFEEDRDGNIWFGTSDNGVMKLDLRSNLFSHMTLARNYDVHALHYDSHGTMWIGTENGLFSACNGKERAETEMNKQMGNASATIIYSITEDDLGQLWIGTLGKGIFVFNKQKRRIAHLYGDHSLPSGSVNHIIKDCNGGVWIATFKGLTYVADPRQPKRTTIYDERTGIKDSHIRAICQDKQGNIWVSTFSGIACLDVHKRRFYNYSNETGIPEGNFVEASTAITADGTIYFGSTGGVCAFNPQTVSHPQRVSDVLITGCERIGRLTGEYINPMIFTDEEGNVRLNHDDNTFKVSFAVKNPAQESSVEYSYMMQGLDDQWYETEGNNEVTFRNLAPGEYTFIVRAKLKNQDWEEASMAQQTIVVTPPVWLTWWAKVGYAIVFLSLCWYFFRSYKKEMGLRYALERTRGENRQKQKLNEERLRFFTNITHELRTPLTLIIGPLEDMMADGQLSPAVSKKIKNIYSNAERLLNLVNDILEFRKTQTQNRRLTVARANLGTMVKEIGMRFKDLNRNDRVNILVNIQEDVPELYFDEEVVTTVVNNLMSNAIKYTPSGSIELSVTQNRPDEVDVTVRDTGYGIDPKALPYICERYYQENGKHQASGTGIGLALVKSLATLHDAELRIDSEKGKGSTFTFVLKVSNTYTDALHKDNETSEADNHHIYNKEEMQTNSGNNIEETQPPVLLIVEDNDDIREYITEYLHDDYRIMQARNGKEGARMAFENIPDIIVSDIMMPEMDGIEMTRLLKNDIRTCHIPIIMLTAKTTAHDQEEGYDSGADSYLMKPFSVRLLHSRIRNILTGRRRLAEYVAQHSIGTPREAPSSSSIEKTETEASTPRLSELDRQFIAKLNALIEKHISTDDLNMAFLTDKMAMSHSTFYRKVKALTGMSANEYVKKAKLRHSMTLLKSRKYTVAEVATLAGFNNQGNFRESFKREFGLTPSEVLRQ